MLLLLVLYLWNGQFTAETFFMLILLMLVVLWLKRTLAATGNYAQWTVYVQNIVNLA